MSQIEVITNEKTKRNYDEIRYYFLSIDIPIKVRTHKVLENIAFIVLGSEGFPGRYTSLLEHYKTLVTLAQSNLLSFDYSRDQDRRVYTLTDRDNETEVSIIGLNGKQPARVIVTTRDNGNRSILLQGDFDFSTQEMS